MANPTGNPVETWKSEFGEDYMRRNPLEAEALREAEIAFRRIMKESHLEGQISSILEVGANVGINLTGWRTVLGPSVLLSAVEPNPKASALLRANKTLALQHVVEADACRLPFEDGTFDLVFTNGVLIHIPPARLPEAMKEIMRVSKRFVLCSEYFSHQPVEIPYRGQTGLLWKRDFGQE